jgi:hypothetical protein
MNPVVQRISRRRLLRAAGVCVGLPWLESLLPPVWGAVKPAAPPRRLAYLYIPNGVNVHEWE